MAEYDGVVAMGEDGIMYEIMHMVCTGVGSEDLMERLRVGIVRCGTINGLEKRLVYRCVVSFVCLDRVFQVCVFNSQFLSLIYTYTK